VSLVEEEELNLSVHFLASIPDRGRHLDFIRLHLDAMKDAAGPIPRSADKLRRDRVAQVAAKITSLIAFGSLPL
jgi:hypothetical protein